MLSLARQPSYASALRWELSARNQAYAKRLGLDCRESRGQPPVVCYLPAGVTHGNFLDKSYREILQNDGWRKRLKKPHTSAHQALPREGFQWCELDSCSSSDALLMNVFCYPKVLTSVAVCNVLGVESASVPSFGVRARVPLANGRVDRTEVDMQLGTLLIEAKLTESNFQQKIKSVVEGYRDFDVAFSRDELPQTDEVYLSYQLIRNVLAACANGCSFCVILDERRPDLREQWFDVIRAIRIHDLRLRCKVLTWQELAEVLPGKLQHFLEEKYGICSGQQAFASPRE
jgi:hypothetical protein